jgi:hypothetical protein
MKAINTPVYRSLVLGALQAASIEVPPPLPTSVPTPPAPEMPPSGPEPTPPEIDEPPLQPNEPIREPSTPPPMAGSPWSRQASSAGLVRRPLIADRVPRLRECSLNDHVVYH